MKKIAVAVAAALLAGSAAAADVTLYGVIDTGFSYTHERAKNDKGETTSTKSFSMDTGNNAGSRWGLKGTEELGNGYKVGFILESQFKSDTGEQKDSRLFNRQALLSVSGDFGTVYAGRMYSLIADSGVTGWYGAMASPFGSGWGEIDGHKAVMNVQGGMDNTLIYMSPRFSGFQFSAQYSMGEDTKENKPSTDRYAAIGVDYQVGNLEVGFLVDYLNKNSSNLPAGVKVDDTYTVNLAANYDFGMLKAFAAVQYFKDARTIGTWAMVEDKKVVDLNHEGFGINLGADIPLCGGNFMVSAGYADADADDLSGSKYADRKVYYGLAGYTYPFSKRTSVYVGAGYESVESDFTAAGKNKAKNQQFQVMTGLVHKF